MSQQSLPSRGARRHPDIHVAVPSSSSTASSRPGSVTPSPRTPLPSSQRPTAFASYQTHTEPSPDAFLASFGPLETAYSDGHGSSIFTFDQSRALAADGRDTRRESCFV
jgi:hypothetical protein